MTKNDTVYKQLPGSNLGCFACGADNPYGLKMTFYADDASVYSDINLPKHVSGWNKLVHGGILSVILDEIMSWAVLNILKKMALTRTMTIEFIKPVPIEQTLKAVGKPLEVMGRHGALLSGEIFDEKGELCAKSEGNYALLSPKLATRMGIVNEATLGDIEKIINA